MTRDDIHKLIAGYATGTLTEAERQALFTAALDDQELFDQLAREQELKELLDEPGVRQRLITSLEPPPRAGFFAAWRKSWSWVAAAATTAAIILGVYLSQPPEPKRFAVFIAPPQPVSPAQPPPFVPPPPDTSQGSPLPPPAAVRRARENNVPSLPPPAPASEKTLADQALPETTGALRRDAVAPAPSPPALKKEADAPAPAPAAAPKAEVVSADQLAQLPPLQIGARGGAAGGGGRGGRAFGGVAENRLLLKAAAPKFGFDYSITAEGRLRVVPSANGYLSVSAAGQLLIANSPLTTAAATELPLPAGATSATIVFSAQQITDSILSIVKNPPAASAGTISDPNPSATSRLELVIAIQPRP